MFQVMASGRGNIVKSIEKPSMASLVKTRSQIQNKLLQQSKDKEQQDVNSLQMKQQQKVLPPLGQKVHPEQNGGMSSQAISQHNVSMANEKNLPMRSPQVVEINTHAKKGQSKTVVAPGTLSVYLRMMKEKSMEKERLSKQIDPLDQPMESSREQQASYLGVQLFEGDTSCNEDEGSQSLDDYVVEEEQNTDQIVEKTNESIPIQDQRTDQLGKG